MQATGGPQGITHLNQETITTAVDAGHVPDGIGNAHCSQDTRMAMVGKDAAQSRERVRITVGLLSSSRSAYSLKLQLLSSQGCMSLRNALATILRTCSRLPPGIMQRRPDGGSSSDSDIARYAYTAGSITLARQRTRQWIWV